MSDRSLIDKFKQREVRALSRLISMAENEDPESSRALSELYSEVGQARVLGITGPPGAGKSSIINHFIRHLRASGKSVAVVAVDPVSPFSGGSLLGDRIRLSEHFNDPKVFIRSLSTRGKLGGLSLATRQAVHLVDAFGFDYVIVETVGVGQSEVDVRKIADLTMVVLVPEWGDAVQTLKAGILEIGDLFTVNKADREGADRIVAELQGMLQLAGKSSTPVVTTTQEDPKTVQALLSVIEGLFGSLKELIAQRRVRFSRDSAEDLVEHFVAKAMRGWMRSARPETTNPYQFLIDFEKTFRVPK